MIVVKLREAMIEYKRRTGERITYSMLAERCGVSETTLSAIASRPGYNTTLDKVDAICAALGVRLSELLERRPELDAKRPKAPKKRPKGKGRAARAKKREHLSRR